jgi:hypothetical protein
MAHTVPRFSLVLQLITRQVASRRPLSQPFTEIGRNISPTVSDHLNG